MMRKLTQTPAIRISLYAILLTSIFVLFGKKTNATVDSTVNFSGGGFTFKFLRLEHDTVNKSNRDTSRAIYEVESLGGSSYQDLSNFYTQMGVCMKKVGARAGKISGSNRNYNSCLDFNSAGELKYDCQLNKGGTYLIFFEVDTVAGLSAVLIGAKAGKKVYKDSIWGFSFDCKDPVPVKVIVLDVVYVAKDRKITWVTATELNNKQFEVERSLDGGKTWGKIATVKTKAESGNSSQLLSYELIDKQILPAGTVPFYRLHQVDYDGTEWTSWVVKPKPIDWESKPFDVSVYPNPASDIVLINLETKELLFGNKLEIYDVLGKVVYQTVFDGKSIQLDMSNLPRGIYKIRLETGNFVKTKSIQLVD